MKRISLVLIALLVFLVGMTGCGSSTKTEPVEVTVFAAASMTNCLDEIITAYASESEDTIIPVYEASGTLREQIEAGADCDIFISANQKHMNTLADENMIDKESRVDLLGNSLTLIASSDVAENISALAAQDFKSVFTSDSIKVLAIGEPSEVPAGQYAQEMFENLGIWEAVQPKVVFAKNVEAVLTYVDGGDAEVGVVYHTDALQLASGSIIADCPADSYTAVSYPAAIMTASPQPDASANFFEYLKSDAAKTVFEKYGFTVLV